VRRYFAIGVCALAGVLISAAPASAAKGQNQGKTTWGQKDTAVYVVSTLNLLHARHGRSISTVLSKRYGVTHFDVFADDEASNLFFIELKTADGSVFGSLAYEMGWPMPLSVSTSLDTLHIRHTTPDVQKEFATDSKSLIGSFTSTLPT